MSVTVLWKPVKDDGTCLSGAKSEFIKTCEKVFGDLPIKLRSIHISQLGTLARLEEHPDEPWSKVIDAIDTHGEIEIWAEY